MKVEIEIYPSTLDYEGILQFVDDALDQSCFDEVGKCRRLIEISCSQATSDDCDIDELEVIFTNILNGLKIENNKNNEWWYNMEDSLYKPYEIVDITVKDLQEKRKKK